MKTKTLSKSEIKQINHELQTFFNISYFDKKDHVVLVEDTITTKDIKVKYLKKDNVVNFFYFENQLVPTLKYLLNNNFLKKITVDMGAVKFICNGADIMRPGITDIEEGIKKDEIISVIDINNKKPIMVGQAMLNFDEMRSQNSGKVIKNLHHVGDYIWSI